MPSSGLGFRGLLWGGVVSTIYGAASRHRLAERGLLHRRFFEPQRPVPQLFHAVDPVFAVGDVLLF